MNKAFINNGTNMLHMEQNVVFEIIEVLCKGKNHARGIAKELGINHMTVLRRIKYLMGENVVDYTQEGRNKVYFIKNTIEGRNYVMMAELNKLNKLLGEYPGLRRVVMQIRKNEKVKLSILFGSYAKFLADKDSDIDIFIESKDRALKREIEQIDSNVRVKLGGYDRSNLLIKEIEKNHVIITGIEEYYEKNKFFS